MINFDINDKREQESINKVDKLQKLIQKMKMLREFVWGEDIPSPTCPEYVELHDIMQKIYREIDTIIDWSES